MWQILFSSKNFDEAHAEIFHEASKITNVNLVVNKLLKQDLFTKNIHRIHDVKKFIPVCHNLDIQKIDNHDSMRID